MTNKRVARIVPQTIWKNNISIGTSKTKVWVFGILKKRLLELGVKILRIHNYQGDWGFLMSAVDGEIVRQHYEVIG